MNNISWWWNDTLEMYSTNKRDEIVLGWKTYYWLALNGWLRTSASMPVIIKKDNQLNFSVQEYRRESIIKALEQANGIQSYASKILGIAPRTLHYHINRYNLHHLCTIKQARKIS